MKENYQDRFIEGILFFMAEKGLQDKKELPKYLDIPYMTLIKIIDGSQNPTAQQCIELCNKAGYSANWLFLGIGEMKISFQSALNDIHSSLEKIHKSVHKK